MIPLLNVRQSQIRNPSSLRFSAIKRMPVGIKNDGNTCYINSVIQIQAHIENFREILNSETIESICTQQESQIKCNPKNENSIAAEKKVITRSLEQILKKLSESSKDINSFVSIIKQNLNAPEFNNSQQQDSMEFLRKLLFAIHTELNIVIKPSSYHEFNKDITEKELLDFHHAWSEDSVRRESSLINEKFNGDLLWDLRCSKCGYRKYSFDKFGELVLDLSGKENGRFSENKQHQPNSNGYFDEFSKRQIQKPKDLESLIQDFFKEEIIDDYQCSSCKQKCQFYRKCRIWTYPQTLFIQIKRFVYYPEYKKQKDKVIMTDERISQHPFTQKVKKSGANGFLKEYVRGGDSGNVSNSNNFSKGSYKLYGYIEHKGEDNYGHYISQIFVFYIKNRYCYTTEDRGWWKYDDDKVSRVYSIKEENPFLMGSEDIYILVLQLENE